MLESLTILPAEQTKVVADEIAVTEVAKVSLAAVVSPATGIIVIMLFFTQSCVYILVFTCVTL